MSRPAVAGVKHESFDAHLGTNRPRDAVMRFTRAMLWINGARMGRSSVLSVELSLRLIETTK